MLFTINQMQDRPRAGRVTTGLRAAPASSFVPEGTGGADALRIIADPRTPTFVTVYANGRRRYSYWRPLDSTTGQGGCYAALPTSDCDELHAAGKIELGDPVEDPNRTTYRVSASPRIAPSPIRSARERPRVVRTARVA
ncbi:hypothetical protein [Streptomyces sp. NPDC050388]|uniref:hypothetical protein n=1 Tax=Streptomyces sp. NPDC050388 TaxID=3155781 RepID=UPI0034240CF7